MLAQVSAGWRSQPVARVLRIAGASQPFYDFYGGASGHWDNNETSNPCSVSRACCRFTWSYRTSEVHGFFHSQLPAVMFQPRSPWTRRASLASTSLNPPLSQPRSFIQKWTFLQARPWRSFMLSAPSSMPLLSSAQVGLGRLVLSTASFKK